MTSDNPRSENPECIIEEILSGMQKDDSLHVETDRLCAIEKALQMQTQKDVVVILGKGDETYQEIQGIKHPFDDRAVVRELLAKLG